METGGLLKKVRKIEIKTKGLSNQVFAGNYHSAFKGRGMSFSEVREYAYGDDVRNIDWNVTARFNSPFVKVFEEEREITAMLLIDISKSSFFGTQKQFKTEFIAEIAAVLSFSAIQNNDKVGVLFFSNKIEKYIPPKKGKKHILRIIRELLETKPSNSGTDIAEALRQFNNLMKRRSIAFLISDFIAPDFKDALSIAKRKHDMIGVHIYDKREKEIPNIGLMQVLDTETGKTSWMDSSSSRTRNKYATHFEENKANARNSFRRAGADFISVSTEEDYVIALRELFKVRVNRR